MSELERQMRTDQHRADPAGRPDVPEEADAVQDEDAYDEPLADVGDANRGPGLDRVGGYGNRPIPQEGGPDQDH